MTRVGIREARSRLSELIERAARGEEIVITRRGEQVARLLPPERPELPELPVKWGQAHALAERIRPAAPGTRWAAASRSAH